MAAVSRASDVICVLKTGGGKTIIPLVAALLEEEQISVVIPPLNSLHMDYQHRLDELGISYVVYTGPSIRVEREHKLIIVSADKAHTPDFLHFLHGVHMTRPVARFVFDEVHLVITAQHYRRTLQHIYELRRIPAQWVLLSGTIPPSSLDTLTHNFHLHEHAVTIREMTNRPELQYLLQPRAHTDQQLISDTTSIYRQHIHEFSSDDRVLIFVPRLDIGYQLASDLGCDFFSGHEAVTQEERRKMYQRWRNGDNRVLVCTCAFGAGNDYPAVRLTIHAGTPLEMVNYVQEVGRAGRDGRRASCYIVPRGVKFPPTPPGTIDHWGYGTMKDYVTNPLGCLRQKITEFTDGFGNGVPCAADPENQRCSKCNPSAVSAPLHTSTSSSEPLNTETIALQTSNVFVSDPSGSSSSNASLFSSSAMNRMIQNISTPSSRDVVHPMSTFNSASSNAAVDFPLSSSSFTMQPSLSLSSSQSSTLSGSSHPRSVASTSSISSFPSSSPPTDISEFSSPAGDKRSSHDVFEEQVQRVKRRRMSTSAAHHQYVQRLTRALYQIDHTCTACLVLQETSDNHTANNCPHFRRSWSQHAQWRRGVNYKRHIHGAVCFYCHVPQMDDALHTFVNSHLDCPFRDIILPLIWCLYHNSEHRMAAEAFFHISLPTLSTLAAWLSAPPVEGHPTNTMALFLWFMEHCN
ncbi:ATP-dependent DNA helicase tlh2 [Leucoagaricus sp. SymC.cos]|nr:ATP-dependent DNA helicase tlh2 [Leucoagaricus sp. SymC.cos]